MKISISRRLRVLLVTCAALPLAAGLWSSQEGQAASSQEKPNRYIGASKCKNCHSSAESGDQHGKWTKEKHAEAFTMLASPETIEVGKAHGAPEPQTDAKCLKCHATAYGEAEDLIKKGFKFEDGVSCESCHGPGEHHMKARMAAAMAGGDAAEERTYTAPPAGEIISNPPAETCLRCHNEESPSYKAFCPQTFKQKIRHNNPLKPRTDAEKAAMANTDPSKDESCMKCHKDK